ncbi:PTS transporter subunit EIIC [Martelella alba]|nr:PTS transporter subunit EIIC [Martelella alba]
MIDALGYFANHFNSLRYFMAIKAAFITLMPVIIVGAFAVLISNMVLDPVTGLASFSFFAPLAALKPIMTSINYATLNFLTIGAVFLIGIELGRLNGSHSLFPGLLAIICFIAVTPTTLDMMVGDRMMLVKDILARQFSDTKSLFLGMFIAILSVEIYSRLEKVDKFSIKMPDSVPPNVSASFMALIPAIITVVLLATFGFVFRRREMKEIAKLSLGPSVFNINEPVIFGMPIMLNPILAVSFILTPLVTGTIGYFATTMGFAGKAVVMVPWTTPPIINAWLSTAGSMGAVFTQILCILVSFLIYLSFVRNRVPSGRPGADSRRKNRSRRGRHVSRIPPSYVKQRRPSRTR